ncbi:MAG: hydroxymethylglutaryl-CoA reductase (NADPH) [Promethearchaeota archaeon]
MDEIIDKIVKGEIKLYRVEEHVDNDVNKATEIRRKALERMQNISLANIGKYSMDMNLTAKRNIENSIGCAQIPIGIAGPLKVTGDYADGEVYIPLATTEGTLVASTNRGCTAITRSGGAKSKIIRDGITRAPALKVPDLEHAYKLVSWVRENHGKIAKVFDDTDPFLNLISIDSWIVGRTVFLRFRANTYDAMGMNTATRGARFACDFITQEQPYAKLISESGNMCVDKKPSAMNWILGRGKTVVSEVILKKEVVRDVLKTTPEKIAELAYRKLFLGGAQALSLGFNAHVANIIAAIFLASGQDAAHVTDSSMSIVTPEVTETGDLYIAVTIPSLETGTFGGGTGLPTQSEALSIMGCHGPGDPPGAMGKKFAEIIAAAALAGEISLLSAQSALHLTGAHERLGRGHA